MVQRGRVLRLATEPQLEGVIPSKICTKHLDRDIPAESQVAAAVHLRHAAIPEQLADLIPPPEEAGLGHRVASPFPVTLTPCAWSIVTVVITPGPDAVVFLGCCKSAIAEPTQIATRTTATMIATMSPMLVPCRGRTG